MKAAIKIALVTMTMIASNAAFADSSDQPVNLDLAVAMEASRDDLAAARSEMIDRGPASEEDSSPTITIEIGDN